MSYFDAFHNQKPHFDHRSVILFTLVNGMGINTKLEWAIEKSNSVIRCLNEASVSHKFVSPPTPTPTLFSKVTISLL